MDQSVLDRAVKIATRAALSGNPVEWILWIPPQSVCDDQGGVFAIKNCPPLSAMDSAPWD